MRTAVLFLIFLTAARAAAGQAAVTGVVKDQSGGVVSGAAVIVMNGTGVVNQTQTGPDGRFSFDKVMPRDATLIVRAGGFAEHSQPMPEGRDLEVVLSPATLLETVTVTPTRTEQRLNDVPASVSVVDKETIRQSPAVVADDVLRLVPTFSLFRRSSSLSSHPTSQGVSLRGIGPSGVSRTLVLVDGVPFNDPFGGWVYWTRVPLDNVDRIEVIDGSSSSLYGNYAMGGVINIIGSRAARRTVELRTQYGSHGSPKADFFGSDVWGKLGVAVEGSVFNTDGFPIVIANERGPIDNNATVDFRNVNVKLDYRANENLSAFLRGGYFTEDRGNGKIGEVNDTRWTSVSGGVRVHLPGESDLQATIFSDMSKFHSTFLAVTAPSATVAPRSIVRLTTDQRVPTDGIGGMVQWSKVIGRSNFLSAGADWRHVDGDSNEDLYSAVAGVSIVPPTAPAVLTSRRVSGGTQRSVSAFVQDVVTFDKFVVTLSVRSDSWKNYDGSIVETAVATGLPTGSNRGALADTDDTAVSPRGALLYHVSDKVTAWADVSSGFRAPTLNELYRQFSVGTTVTRANENLGPERLRGGEAGVRVEATRNLSVRSTWYENRVKNPVSNVTIAVSPTGAITQQRQNLGRTRVRGWQSDAEVRLGSSVRVSAGYLLNDAKVTEFAANPALVGLYLPQVPRHRGSVSVAYSNPRYATVSLNALFFGRQFDDDLNARVKPGETKPGLPPYGTVEFSASRTINRNFDVFFGVQNLFDQEYYVMLLPTTIGTPRLVNGGIRVRWAAQ